LMMRVETGGLPDDHKMGQLPFKSKPIKGWNSPIRLAIPSVSKDEISQELDIIS
jgi:hypothetical protein